MQWCWCVPLRGKDIPGQAVSGMWALFSPQPLPGCEIPDVTQTICPPGGWKWTQ